MFLLGLRRSFILDTRLTSYADKPLRTVSDCRGRIFHSGNWQSLLPSGFPEGNLLTRGISMFADPLTITGDWSTITADAGENQVFQAIERAADHSLYGQNDGSPSEYWRLYIGHQFGRRNRYTVRLTVNGLTPDLLIDGNNSQYTQSCFVVFDSPSVGPINPSGYSGISLPNYMMKLIGGFLVSVDTADPLFKRVLNGET
jgi:hypothetical protein